MLAAPLRGVLQRISSQVTVTCSRPHYGGSYLHLIFSGNRDVLAAPLRRELQRLG